MKQKSNLRYSLRVLFMQIRHYCKHFIQLLYMLLNASDLWTSFPQWIHSASVHVLFLGFVFFLKVLFKERATYLSSANNTEIVFCFQSSIQWVLRWCKWPDSGTIQEDQWVSKCLLGMGWRRWWSLEQVSCSVVMPFDFVCLAASIMKYHPIDV